MACSVLVQQLLRVVQCSAVQGRAVLCCAVPCRNDNGASVGSPEPWPKKAADIRVERESTVGRYLVDDLAGERERKRGRGQTRRWG